MATGETGFDDVTYDLISVQYHSLTGSGCQQSAGRASASATEAGGGGG